MKRIGIILITILSFLLITFAGVYFFGVFYFRHWFCPNTYINGVNVSNKNFSVCDTLINESVVNHNLVIEDTDGTQIFIDGNKRAAVIYANHYMISRGLGLIVISEQLVSEFKQLLIKYYEGDDNEHIVSFLKTKCWLKLS